MNISPYLGKPQTLSKWINECIDNPGQQFWLLYLELDIEEDVYLSTQMYPVLNTNELSDEEYDELEQSIIDCGYSYFLSLDQIVDVIENLSMQVDKVTRIELLHAINFYFIHDAFWDVTKD